MFLSLFFVSFWTENSGVGFFFCWKEGEGNKTEGDYCMSTDADHIEAYSTSTHSTVVCVSDRKLF